MWGLSKKLPPVSPLPLALGRPPFKLHLLVPDPSDLGDHWTAVVQFASPYDLLTALPKFVTINEWKEERDI